MNLNQSRFTEMLIEANELDRQDFKNWVFCPGMLFNSTGKWWGDHGRRDFPHEGIDLCLYNDISGRIHRLDEKIRIPVMHDGVVKALFADYLGQAVIIEHDGLRSETGRYISVYAHTKPLDEIKPGIAVKQGGIIGTIADTSRSKAKILPHLHLSFGRPSPGLVYEPFVWNIMRDPDRVTLLDPLNAIGWPWQVMDPNHEFCLAL